MKFRLFLLIVLMVTSLAAQNSAQLAAQNSTQPAAAQRRPITDKDLFDFVWVANPQLSPDGSVVAFTRVNVDEKRTGYESSIWMVSTGGQQAPVKLTNGKHDAQPRWSPDGKRIAFIRGGDKDESGKPKPGQLAILSLTGGEARIITDLPKGASSPVWSPDGKQIAFLSDTTAEDIQKAQRKKNALAKPSDSEHESDVHVITRAVYRSNDEGYLDPKHHSHIWTIQVPSNSDESPKPVQLTSGNYDEHDVIWAPDGSRIYFLSRHVDEPYYDLPSSEIYSVAASGGTPEKLATIPMGIRGLALSPDGRKLAFHASVTEPVRSYSEPDLWIMDVAPNAKPRNLTADYDFDMGSSVFGDNAAPRGGRGRLLYWSADGRWLFDIVEKRGRTPIVRVDAQTGAVTELSKGDQAVLDFSVTPDAGKIVALVSTPDDDRRSLHRCCRRRPNSPDRRQSEALVAAQPHRPGGDRLHQLRRQAHSGLDPEAARLRSAKEVSAHPQYSRRPARRLRLGLRS